LHDHTIICGYGTKGRSAFKTLIGKGLPAERIVAIDPSDAGQANARGDGIAVIAGDATSQDALREAGIADARSVIVAVERDDTAILVTLTARELNADATIVAAAREEENVHLLHQGGADGVITSSSAAGRLLGLSSDTPQVTEVLEDILTLGKGLDIVEREVGPEEAVHTRHTHQTALLAIVRGDELIRFGDPRAGEIRPGDKVVELRNAVLEEGATAPAGPDAGR
jgi:voltage-gated potassium channel